MWHGKTVVCIASGPSLNEADCQAVQASGHPTIAINHSWKMAPFCEVIYAVDTYWWIHYGDEINISAQRWTGSSSKALAKRHNTKRHFISNEGVNSGARAIELAVQNGPKRIVLLGYDCNVRNGIHWHGKHIKTGNPTPAKCRMWLKQFDNVAELAKREGIEILNCSRVTSITSFARADLIEALK